MPALFGQGSHPEIIRGKGVLAKEEGKSCIYLNVNVKMFDSKMCVIWEDIHLIIDCISDFIQNQHIMEFYHVAIQNNSIVNLHGYFNVYDQ